MSHSIKTVQEMRNVLNALSDEQREQLEAAATGNAVEFEIDGWLYDNNDLEAMQDCVEGVTDNEWTEFLIDAYLEDNQGNIADAGMAAENCMTFESVEAYGIELIDCSDFRIPDDLRSYFDFEQYGQDALTASCWTETNDGQVIIWS